MDAISQLSSAQRFFLENYDYRDLLFPESLPKFDIDFDIVERESSVVEKMMYVALRMVGDMMSAQLPVKDEAEASLLKELIEAKGLTFDLLDFGHLMFEVNVPTVAFFRARRLNRRN